MQSKLKILVIIDHLNFGGAQKVVLENIKYINKGKYLPVVCSLRNESPLSRQIEALGVKVFNLGHSKYSLWPLISVIRIIQREEIDLIHTHLFKSNTLGILASIITKKPVVCHCHIDYNQHYAGWQKLLEKALMGYADQIIPVSYAIADAYAKIVVDHASRVKLILNSVDLDKFKRCPRNEADAVRAEISARKYVVGTVGRLSEQKGIKYFIEAAKLLQGKDITWLIVGDGPLSQQLVELSQQLGVRDRVVFAGFREQVIPYLCGMDVVVFPSLYEGLPMALLEAMALEIPVVATDIAGFREFIVSDETGQLVPPENAARLAEKISRCLENRGLALSCAQKARKLAEDLGSSKIISKLEQTYEEVYREHDIRR